YHVVQDAIRSRSAGEFAFAQQQCYRRFAIRHHADPIAYLVLGEGLARDKHVPRVVFNQQDLDHDPRIGGIQMVSCWPSDPGSVHRIVVPDPESAAGSASVSTQIRPPWKSTIFLHSASPIPVPEYASLGCRRWKITNTRSA